MNFGWTEEQESIRDAVSRVCAGFDADYWLEKDRKGGFPLDFHQAIAQAGWLGICMPEEYGGAGLGVMEAAIMMEAISGSGAGMSGVSAIHMNIFGLNPVVVYGTPEQKQRMLPPLIQGNEKACFGVTEPNTGLNTTQLKTFAKKDGDRYVVLASKLGAPISSLSLTPPLLLVRPLRLEHPRDRHPHQPHPSGVGTDRVAGLAGYTMTLRKSEDIGPAHHPAQGNKPTLDIACSRPSYGLTVRRPGKTPQRGRSWAENASRPRTSPQSNYHQNDFGSVNEHVRQQARFGAMRAGWGNRRVADLERLLRSAFVSSPDDLTATAFARLRLACKHAGHPLHQKVHTGDLWIAATAVRWDLTLVSDAGVFDDCPELTLIRESS